MNRFRLVVLVTVLFAGLTMGCSKGGGKSAHEALDTYLRLDSEGKGLSSDGFQELKKYTLWEEAPGWDTVTVIGGYSIDSLQTADTRGKASVTYKRLGVLSSRFEPSGPETVTYFLRQDKGTWRVDGPQLMPHVSLAVIEERLRSAEDVSPDVKKENEALLRQLQSAHPS